MKLSPNLLICYSNSVGTAKVRVFDRISCIIMPCINATPNCSPIRVASLAIFAKFLSPRCWPIFIFSNGRGGLDFTLLIPLRYIM